MISRIPFKVNYPLKVINNKKVNFLDEEERQELFRRNIYYTLFSGKKNDLLEKNYLKYYDISMRVSEHLNKNYPQLEILSLSLFGSSTVLENPGDYDFLVVTNGDITSLEETTLSLGQRKFPVGISIKGVENFENGFEKKGNTPKSKMLEQLIDRTSISLFRRHIPLLGNDFVNNEKEFYRNVYAQVSDLVNNSYELFYLVHNRKVSEYTRAKKLLTRCYEASSYLEVANLDDKTKGVRKELYNALNKEYSLDKSKKIFDKFVSLLD